MKRPNNTPQSQTKGSSRRCQSAPSLYRSALRWLWGGLGLGLLQVAIAAIPQLAKPAPAAERITISLGATIERSISVESLEIYVEEGRVTDELAPYIDFIGRTNPGALEQARELLSRRLDVDVTTVAQFAYTPQGEYLLEQAGEVFRTGARLPGGQGLRGAAIMAAADEAEGLTVINVIRRFPTPVLRIDLRRGFAFADRASTAVKEANLALDLVEAIAFRTAAEPLPPGVSAAELNQSLTQPGPFSVKRDRLQIKNAEPIDIYIPQTPFTATGGGFARKQVPTVVISHGLGNERESYAYLAEFLASHGFGVINVEHPGSSANQFDALVAGRTNQVVPDDEFIDRPRLISAVLDELSARAMRGKSFSHLNLENVGLIGQSFGGYTALALGGAPLSFASLRSNCPPAFSANISRLLQCQALTIADPESETLSFTDARVKAVVAINPITSLVFGPDSLSQIDLPILMMSSSADTVAPALPEQVRPFTWLTTPDRYLVMLAGGTHFSTIGVTGNETFQLPPSIFGPVPEVAQEYTRAMSLAFLTSYLKRDRRYQSALTSAFTTRFSHPEMPISIISALDPIDLQLQLQRAADTDVVETAIEDFADTETARFNR